MHSFDPNRSAAGILRLRNGGFYPFKHDTEDFVSNILRSFDNLNPATDRFSYVVRLHPVHNEGVKFYFSAKWGFLLLRMRIALSFFKYVFSIKTESDWKSEGRRYFEEKIRHELYRTEIFLVSESSDQFSAQAAIRSVYSHFSVFENYPLNEFRLVDVRTPGVFAAIPEGDFKGDFLSPEEISFLFHFPANPKLETSLLKVSGRRLAPPIGIPVIGSRMNHGKLELSPDDLRVLTPIGTSDYRSIGAPIGIHDQDRLRHAYVVGQTGTGKSKAILRMMISDMTRGHGFCMIDPHGDAFEELLMHIPDSRKEDVIIFDPTDEKFPFRFNPLDIKRGESKQILAKGFIDIFKKFFGSNWNPKLEHVLRMVFLGLLDRKGSTLFDIIRALTDKDFRYAMIESAEDDVVRNFWSNEFAGWSQQFNSEAIMPILNKVGQLLSIDLLKNIFASSENKLDFREAMDSGKIILIKLPKGQLQEEIMGFLGAMFITKIFQSAMGRQALEKENRRPFFLYVDEFQNFTTDTFAEILSEARKYGLSLTVAHQYLKQIPENLSNALFGNVGTILAFRTSSQDSLLLEKHFSPYVSAHDLSNLNAREFYCRTLVNGQIKPPFSLRTLDLPDASVDRTRIAGFYDLSRKKYSRPLTQATKAVQEEQKDVIAKIETFSEPIL